MANGDDSPSGFHRVAQMLPLGDSKKAKIIRHAASSGGGALGLIVLLHAYPTMLPYVQAAANEDTVKTVTTVTTEVRSMKSELSEFKSESRQDSRDTQALIRQVLTSQGVVPVVPEKPKERRKIIEVHYNDTLGTGFYMSEDRDTAFIPMPDTLETIRPR